MVVSSLPYGASDHRLPSKTPSSPIQAHRTQLRAGSRPRLPDTEPLGQRRREGSQILQSALDDLVDDSGIQGLIILNRDVAKAVQTPIDGGDLRQDDVTLDHERSVARECAPPRGG